MSRLVFTLRPLARERLSLKRMNFQSNTIQPIGVVCPACTSVVPAPSIAVQLENAIRSHISRYYLGWTVCDGDDGCGARTRMMGVYGRRCLGMEREGCKGTVRLEVGWTCLFTAILHCRRNEQDEPLWVLDL